MMEPALDVIGRALSGDEGARAFLERTSSIYVLDVTDKSNPKTYGCWNFIHQALNEIERYESKIYQLEKNSPTTTKTTTDHWDLVHHVRLLATMALRVARRPPQSDRAIVATCISNASDYNCNPSQAQWLLDLNLELREIVMGRIAAMAFDFSFHRGGITGSVVPANSTTDNNHTAFADDVVMDTFNAILAANAVSSGPSAVRHFATEWIIPSSRNIPVSALISIAHHLALEGMRASSPAGTLDTLQQLSIPIASMVLIPAMANAVTDNSNEDELPSSASGIHLGNSRILTKSLAALNVWCEATSLTLPQLKHISSKIDFDIVDILNDAMYSDSPAAVDALADFIERTVESPFDQEISEDRMNQVRHIINVDETSFKANFSASQLRNIEQKEMSTILEKLVCAVGLQRVRFVERQNQGDLEVCRNLARIGKAVSMAWLEIYKGDEQIQPERGIIEFLLKTAYHPSLSICGLTLSVIHCFASKTNLLAKELIPLLQRKAIIPHYLDSETGNLAIAGDDEYGASVDEFLRFRESVLAEALTTCCEFESDAYIESCTSAIEEFCATDTKQDGARLSFHLEAALFCVETLGFVLSPASTMARVDCAAASLVFSEHFFRCISAVSQKHVPSFASNPLTVARLSILLQRWAFWFHKKQKIGIAMELAATALSYSLQVLDKEGSQLLLHETNISPVKEASLAFEELIRFSVKHFSSNRNLATLLKIWDSVYAQRVGGKSVSVEAIDIEPLGRGICSIILTMPEDIRNGAYDSLFSQPLTSIDQIILLIRAATNQKNVNELLKLIGGEIHMLARLAQRCSTLLPTNDSDMEDVIQLSERSKCIDLPLHIVCLIQRCWPNVQVLATDFCSNLSISSSIQALTSSLIPIKLEQNDGMERLRQLTAVVCSMQNSATENVDVFGQSCLFLKAWVLIHGGKFELIASTPGACSHPQCREMVLLFKQTLTDLAAKAKPFFVSYSDNTARVQGQGQPAFESRPAPMREVESTEFACLGPLLDLLGELQTVCPVFLQSLQTGSKLFIEEAARSAIIGILSSDSDLALSAIMFLSRLAGDLLRTTNETLRGNLEANLIRGKEEAICRLIAGCCGKFERKLLNPAADLLYVMVKLFGVESCLVTAMNEGSFLLGDDAKDLTLSILRRCSEGTLAETDLAAYLRRVWEIHLTDDSSSLCSSDAVARLIRNFLI